MSDQNVYKLGEKVYKIFLDELADCKVPNIMGVEPIQDYNKLPLELRNLWAAVGVRMQREAVLVDMVVLADDIKLAIKVNRTDRDSRGRLVLIADDGYTYTDNYMCTRARGHTGPCNGQRRPSCDFP